MAKGEKKKDKKDKEKSKKKDKPKAAKKDKKGKKGKKDKKGKGKKDKDKKKDKKGKGKKGWKLSPLLERYAPLYDTFARVSELAIRQTDTGDAPWHLIESENKLFRDLTAGHSVRGSSGSSAGAIAAVASSSSSAGRRTGMASRISSATSTGTARFASASRRAWSRSKRSRIVQAMPAPAANTTKTRMTRLKSIASSFSRGERRSPIRLNRRGPAGWGQGVARSARVGTDRPGNGRYRIDSRRRRLTSPGG